MAADYWRSSQANQWLLDPLDLEVSRVEDLRYAGDKDKLAASTIFLASAISSLAKRLHLRQRVTATATVFFHRFYSVPPNGYTNTDPCLVATACVYVASKVEETPIHVKTVMHEAGKMWNEYGHTTFPISSVDLAEMEFYLLRDLDYHLVLHHPYRPLLQLAGTVGKAAVERAEAAAQSSNKSGAAGRGAASSGQTGVGMPYGLGIHADALSVGSSKMGGMSFDMTNASAAGNHSASNGKGGNDEERERDRREEEAARKALVSGDHGLPIARVEEIDQDVVQMAWFLLNDTYRHAHLHLLYPPYILALAALCLALVLHDPSREKMLASVTKMEGRRKRARDLDEAGGGEGEKATKVAASTPAASSAAPPMPPRAAPSSIPPRPAHLPPKPGGSTSGLPTKPQASHPSLGIGSGHDDSPAAGAPGLTASSSSIPSKPTPPSDVLTFLSLLNLSPRSQLASCIQSILDGYATWMRCHSSLLEGKRIVGWLDEWRRKREEELRVLEHEGLLMAASGRKEGGPGAEKKG